MKRIGLLNMHEKEAVPLEINRSNRNILSTLGIKPFCKHLVDNGLRGDKQGGFIINEDAFSCTRVECH